MSILEPAPEPRAYQGDERERTTPVWWLFWSAFALTCLGLVVYWTAHDAADDRIPGRGTVPESGAEDAVSEIALAAMLREPASLERGRLLFLEKCAACHLEQGEGIIGPNLTDAYWIHGTGTLMDLHSVIRFGVVAKGMPAWERQLSPEQLRQVVAFTGSLRGTNRAGKAPEGNRSP